ncbi:MAG: hypothetical protein UT66_C0008G0006 [candidate division CPR2 bacterium GW2011_GWC1_39_9]|uniref:Uncharacterized protein n=1 Tax=candidate division CPR2 bacterium GW2011_GWC2_39_10 TaxID=1618345 RepID=A0A0G0M4D8_UNCC2|nr:MAG: hypothetical protein UT18_C0003G0029 [candidate division CPR2 bacterium GW2011_GWC2_39_10]KKR35664.1 MAG: hypothetical protein UT66_C0008G0006 [candidate division CPR2 bacterium GW2011_GWC1_39_9]
MLKKSKKGKVLSKSKGFTLIELLVVMAIIAILVTLMIWAINTARMQSRNTQRRSNITSMKAALESYYSSKKDYPGTVGTDINIVNLKALFPTYATFDVEDPRGATDDNRSCYSKVSRNQYNLRILPEPETLGTCANTLAVGEDFSIQ